MSHTEGWYQEGTLKCSSAISTVHYFPHQPGSSEFLDNFTGESSLVWVQPALRTPQPLHSKDGCPSWHTPFQWCFKSSRMEYSDHQWGWADTPSIPQHRQPQASSVLVSHTNGLHAGTGSPTQLLLSRQQITDDTQSYLKAAYVW